MYTPEKDFSEATYFQAIETMMIPNLREKEASQVYHILLISVSCVYYFSYHLLMFYFSTVLLRYVKS